MFLILRLFNSFLFVIANLSVAIYTLHRFFRAMKFHRQLIHEVEEYGNSVDRSRASLQYVSSKVTEAMKEMEADIEREVYITHNLTKLAPKIASASKRFTDLEEGIIELARLEHNMENATVETPVDINEEVLRILRAIKHQNQNHHHHHQVAVASEPTTTGAAATVATERLGGNSGNKKRRPYSPPTPGAKFTSAVPVRSTAQAKSHVRPRSPNLVVPEVSLLNEDNYAAVAKPIGFRPPWMCQV